MLWKRLSLCLLAAACLLSYTPAALAAEEDTLPVQEQLSAEQQEELPAEEQEEPSEPKEEEPSLPEEEEPAGPEGSPEPPEEAKPFPFLCEKVSDLLETEAHNSYVSGYKNGSFQPEGKITRAETAQLFYSLLKDKPELTASFSDVPEKAWYSTQVRALASLGAISGYPSGEFRPNRNITRAEFVSIAARFSAPLPGEAGFSDVGQNWATPAISSAVSHGWIRGYKDGTFRPDASITRAEAVTIVNAMLGRVPDSRMVTLYFAVEFSDVSRSYWAYPQICEAATAHEYTLQSGKESWVFPDRYDGSGWVTEDGDTFYLAGEAQEPLIGFQHIGEYTYYFDPNSGKLLTGWKVIDGKHYLLPEKNQESRSLKISELLTKINYRAAHRSFDDIQYIAVHYTATPGDTARGECLAFQDVYRAASAHYFVDGGGAWRCVMDRDISWHCGNDVYYHDFCRNSNSIGIEMCCLKGDPSNAYSAYDSDWYFSEQTMENTSKLVRELMMRYGIPLENVVRHNDISHKVCPAPFVNDFSAWQKFLDRVSQNKTDYKGAYPARITASKLTVYSGPGSGYSAVATLKKNDTVTVLEERGKDIIGSGRWVKIRQGWIPYEYISRL